MKQILDVADNLERASEAVPAAALSSENAVDLQKQLSMLLEGVKMTQRVLNHVRHSCIFLSCALLYAGNWADTAASNSYLIDDTLPP